MDREAGQAALEHVAVVAVVGAVLAAAAFVGPARAGEVAGSIGVQVRRALCVVGGGDCERDRAPCVVAAREERDHWGARLLVVRLGAGWIGLVERRSDGRLGVARVREDELGLDLGSGAKAGVALGRLGGVSLGGEARAAVLAHRREGLSWVVEDRAQADALLRSLRADRWASVSGSGIVRAIVDGRSAVPEPDEVHGERGWGVALGGEGGAGVASGSVDLSADDAWGTRRRRDGHRVLYLRRTAALAAALGVQGLGETSGAAGRDAVLGLEVDASGRPVDLSLVETGPLEGSADLPAAVQEAAGFLAGEARGDRRWSVEHHLDLTVPANLAAAREAITAVQGSRTRFGDPTAAGAALRARLAVAAVVHARTYAVEAEEHGAGVEGSVLGVGAGVEGGREVTSTRLLAAATRGLDGRWALRTDCLAAA